MNMNEIEVYVPNGVEDPRIAETRKAIQEYAKERISAIEADAAEVTADNWKAHKLNQFDDAKKALADKSKAVASLVAQKTGAAALLVQLKASENEIKAAIEERQKVIIKMKAENAAPLPTHTYLVRMTCTDEVLGKVLEYAKDHGAAEFVWCVPQSDKAVKAAQKLFEENV